MNRVVVGSAAVVAAAVLATGGAVVGTNLADEPTPAALSTTPPPTCAAFPGMDPGACGAAGYLKFGFWYGEQGANQFCKWRAANPGEWSRIKGYAATGTLATNIVTWQGGALVNVLQAQFSLGTPPFTIEPNPTPNICGGKLIAPPVIQSVTPGETDVTITVEGP